MKGNILETMKELGAAMDDGVELEWRLDLTTSWVKRSFKIDNQADIPSVIKWIKAGRIRTKPRWVEVVLFYDEGIPDPVDIMLARAANTSLRKSFKTSNHTIPLDGD